MNISEVFISWLSSISPFQDAPPQSIASTFSVLPPKSGREAYLRNLHVHRNLPKVTFETGTHFDLAKSEADVWEIQRGGGKLSYALRWELGGGHDHFETREELYDALAERLDTHLWKMEMPGSESFTYVRYVKRSWGKHAYLHLGFEDLEWNVERMTTQAPQKALEKSPQDSRAPSVAKVLFLIGGAYLLGDKITAFFSEQTAASTAVFAREMVLAFQASRIEGAPGVWAKVAFLAHAAAAQNLAPVIEEPIGTISVNPDVPMEVLDVHLRASDPNGDLLSTQYSGPPFSAFRESFSRDRGTFPGTSTASDLLIEEDVLITVGTDIRAYEIFSGQHVATYSGSTSCTRGVQVPGMGFFACGPDGTVILNLPDLTVVRTIPSLGGAVENVAFDGGVVWVARGATLDGYNPNTGALLSSNIYTGGASIEGLAPSEVGSVIFLATPNAVRSLITSNPMLPNLQFVTPIANVRSFSLRRNGLNTYLYFITGQSGSELQVWLYTNGGGFQFQDSTSLMGSPVRGIPTGPYLVSYGQFAEFTNITTFNSFQATGLNYNTSSSITSVAIRRNRAFFGSGASAVGVVDFFPRDISINATLDDLGSHPISLMFSDGRGLTRSTNGAIDVTFPPTTETSGMSGTTLPPTNSNFPTTTDLDSMDSVSTPPLSSTPERAISDGSDPTAVIVGVVISGVFCLVCVGAGGVVYWVRPQCLGFQPTDASAVFDLERGVDIELKKRTQSTRKLFQRDHVVRLFSGAAVINFKEEEERRLLFDKNTMILPHGLIDPKTGEAVLGSGKFGKVVVLSVQAKGTDEGYEFCIGKLVEGEAPYNDSVIEFSAHREAYEAACALYGGDGIGVAPVRNHLEDKKKYIFIIVSELANLNTVESVLQRLRGMDSGKEGERAVAQVVSLIAYHALHGLSALEGAQISHSDIHPGNILVNGKRTEDRGVKVDVWVNDFGRAATLIKDEEEVASSPYVRPIKIGAERDVEGEEEVIVAFDERGAPVKGQSHMAIPGNRLLHRHYPPPESVCVKLYEGNDPNKPIYWPYDGFKYDLWSLGVTLWVSLTGKTPQQLLGTGLSINKLKERLKNELGDAKPGTIRWLISRLLQVDPNKRLPASELLKLELDCFGKEELEVAEKVIGNLLPEEFVDQYNPSQPAPALPAVNKEEDYANCDLPIAATPPATDKEPSASKDEDYGNCYLPGASSTATGKSPASYLKNISPSRRREFTEESSQSKESESSGEEEVLYSTNVVKPSKVEEILYSTTVIEPSEEEEILYSTTT